MQRLRSMCCLGTVIQAHINTAEVYPIVRGSAAGIARSLGSASARPGPPGSSNLPTVCVTLPFGERKRRGFSCWRFFSIRFRTVSSQRLHVFPSFCGFHTTLPALPPWHTTLRGARALGSSHIIRPGVVFGV